MIYDPGKHTLRVIEVNEDGDHLEIAVDSDGNVWLSIEVSGERGITVPMHSSRARYVARAILEETVK